MEFNTESIKKIAIIVISILAIIIFTVSVINMKKSSKNTEKTESIESTEEVENESASIATTYEETFYSDGTEDVSYNYITNASILSEYTHDLPYTVTTEIGDVFNKQFKSSGISGSQLRITDILNDEINNSLVFTVQSEDGTEIEGTYSKSSNSWIF